MISTQNRPPDETSHSVTDVVPLEREVHLGSSLAQPENTLSIFLIMGSAHCTAAGTSDSVLGLAWNRTAHRRSSVEGSFQHEKPTRCASS
jgi:hypothetical protein